MRAQKIKERCWTATIGKAGLLCESRSIGTRNNDEHRLESSQQQSRKKVEKERRQPGKSAKRQHFTTHNSQLTIHNTDQASWEHFFFPSLLFATENTDVAVEKWWRRKDAISCTCRPLCPKCLASSAGMNTLEIVPTSTFPCLNTEREDRNQTLH